MLFMGGRKMMTREEFRKMDYEELADAVSSHITIRTYDKTGSHDDTRETTQVEKAIIKKIARSAFLSFGYGDSMDLDTIANMAEFTLMQFIPEANTYDTIYIPIMKLTGKW